MTWIWLQETVVFAVHDRQIAEHGGSGGVRDKGAVLSALARLVNRAAYENADAAIFAAAYAFGLAKNHAFVDGNKRIAFMSMMAFLRKNGVSFAPAPAHATKIILALAAGEVSEESLARWIRDNWPKEE